MSHLSGLNVLTYDRGSLPLSFTPPTRGKPQNGAFLVLREPQSYRNPSNPVGSLTGIRTALYRDFFQRRVMAASAGSPKRDGKEP